MCVQVNLDKPLLRKIYISKIEQCVQYEGINALCFSCGRIGHKREACPYYIREPTKEMGMEQNHESENTSNATPIDKGVEGKNEGYGDWMVVSRCKPLNKTKAKLLGPEMSNLAELSQTSSSNSNSRMLGHDKK